MDYKIIEDIKSKSEDVSITLSLNMETMPGKDSNQNKIALKNLLKELNLKLEKNYDKKFVVELNKQMKRLEDNIIFNGRAKGMIIFISKNYTDYYKLPFAPGNTITIEDRFSIKLLIQAMQDSKDYYILTVSPQKTRLIECSDDKVIGEVKNNFFPFTNTEFYTDKKLEKSFSSTLDKYTTEFLRVADKRLNEMIVDENYKVILAGNVEALTIYKNIMKQPKNLVGEIYGAFDTEEPINVNELMENTSEIFKKYKAEKEGKLSYKIDDAQSKNLLESDIFSIFNFTEKGQIKELFIKESLFVPAALDANNNLVSTMSDDAVIYLDDAVAKIIKNIDHKVIPVTFVSNDFFETTKDMYAILNWR